MRDVRTRALLITAVLTVAGGLLLVATQTDEYDTSIPNVLPPESGPLVIPDNPQSQLADETGVTQENKSLTTSTTKKSKNAADREKEKIQQAMAAHAQERIKLEINQQFQKSVALLQEKKFDEAVTALHRVLQLAPTMPEANANMGFAMLGLKRYAAARDFFSASIQLNKNQINAYYGLAMAHDGLQDLPAAINAMRVFQHLVPADDAFRKRADAILKEWEAQPSAEPKPESG